MDYFEVQRLNRAGDTTGHWETISPITVEGDPLARCQADLKHLRETMPGDAFRIVPYGFGPNPRPGDVLPDGSIMLAIGGTGCAAGIVSVSPEQADNALLFGWERTSPASSRAVRFVEIERKAASK